MNRSRRIVPVVLLLLSLLSLSSPALAATAKPPRLLIPAGAAALYWSYPMPLPMGMHYGTMKITNLSHRPGPSHDQRDPRLELLQDPSLPRRRHAAVHHPFLHLHCGRFVHQGGISARRLS